MQKKKEVQLKDLTQTLNLDSESVVSSSWVPINKRNCNKNVWKAASPLGLLLCLHQDDVPVRKIVWVHDPGAQAVSSKPTREEALPLSLFFYAFSHIKQTATTKRFMHVDFRSLKNDPQQSCFSPS